MRRGGRPARPQSSPMTTARMPAPATLRPSDLARLAAVGLRTRKLRATLSALGIAIGVAAIVAVLGLSSSSQAGCSPRSSALGTNLLTVQNGQDQGRRHRRAADRRPGDDRPPARRHPRPGHRRQSAPTSTAARLSPPSDTNALSVDAASLGLPAAVGTSIAQGATSTPPPPASPSRCSAPPPPSD